MTPPDHQPEQDQGQEPDWRTLVTMLTGVALVVFLLLLVCAPPLVAVVWSWGF